ncbi:hypothetical protein RRG08_041759 [Elysia crispata]|uniref:G-protein coupled receptors family 1 profile domain-containing protein n=1 Tax=Elysia crispata TaxID=231223 RepID=A0AAE0Z0E3_9GAST|nr:hypothetical protein RRG08_041759 [Elysia crispata]
MASSTYVYPYFQNSTLLSLSFVRESGGRNDHYLGLTIFHIFLASWVGVANSSQIINVILSDGLRRQPKTILICNVCVAELIMGVFLCPLYTDTLMQGTWRHNTTLCAVYELTFYLQVGVSTLAVLVVAVERLYFLLTPGMMEGSGGRCITIVLLCVPWIIGAALVVPIFKFGTVAIQSENAGPCQLLWKSKFQAVVVFISFLCPAFLLLCVVVALHALHVVMKVHAKRRDLGPHPEKKAIKESLRVVLLVSTVCVVLQFPFFVILFKAVLCHAGGPTTSCGIETSTWSATMAILMLKAGVTPVAWMAYTDIRVWFRQGLAGMVCGSKGVAEDDLSCRSNDQESYVASVGHSRQAILQTSPM